MMLIQKVRSTLKQLIDTTKNLTVSRDVDVFEQLAFDYSMSSITFGLQRQVGTFSIQYLISPKPESGNTAPSITYDQIISAFDAQKIEVFKLAGLVLLSYSYEQSDIVTDPITGSVSLSFTINIQVTEKIR
ncbi:hypothetical protein [Enterobacter sp. C4G1]|uniref:hypothetical protein n=1 Tax=Enterobacter sp. C4G1 TaxID=3458724 RepID=UPI004067F1BE